jgi:DNA processing protein
MNSTEACIALNMLPTIGPVRLRKLLQVFETPERILAARGSASMASVLKLPSKSLTGKASWISQRSWSASASLVRR